MFPGFWIGELDFSFETTRGAASNRRSRLRWPDRSCAQTDDDWKSSADYADSQHQLKEKPASVLTIAAHRQTTLPICNCDEDGWPSLRLDPFVKLFTINNPIQPPTRAERCPSCERSWQSLPSCRSRCAIQRGHQHQRVTEITVDPLAIDGHAGDAVFDKAVRGVMNQANRVQQVMNHHHLKHSPEVALAAAKANRSIVAHHLNHDHRHRFTLCGVHLPRHD